MTTKPKTHKAPAVDPIFALIAEHKAVGADPETAWRAWNESSMQLAQTKPTALAGAAAFVAYVAQDGVAGHSDWHIPALKTCAAALKRMGKTA